MKLKGISTVEQHIEKIVLGVFVAFAMAMLVLQVMREPNTAELQGGKKVTPATASEAVSEMAKSVNSQLDSQTTPAIPKTPELEQEFVKLLSQTGGESPMRLVERWGDESENAIATKPTESSGGGDNLYFEPVPPAPTGIVAHLYEGTIDPVEPLRFPELAKFLPAKQPYDTRFVSVEGVFDAAALREELKREADKRDALPSSWWTGRTEILDVELVRARVKEDGSLDKEEAIGALPGRYSMRERVRDEKLAPKDLTDILEKERANRAEIRRPRFYTMIAGVPWAPPSAASAAGGVTARPARVDQLLREIENVDREIKRINDQLAPPPPPGAPGPGGPGAPGGPGGRPPAPGQNPDRDAPPPPRRDGSRADAGTSVKWPEIPSDWLAQAGKPGGAGGGRGGESGPTPEEEKAAREERRRKTLEASLEKLKAQRERAVTELDTLGFDDKGERKQSDPGVKVDPTAPEPVLSVLDQTAATISVWAHDVTAKAGETYKYKLRVAVVNPFFGNASALTDAQKSRAAVAGLWSADSDWSEPVTIAPSTQFFVTDARDSAAGVRGVGRSDASADVEVYEFFYGYWRRGAAKLEPGDQVRATIELPELPLFNVKLDEKGAPVVEKGGTAEKTRQVSAPTFLLGVSREAGQGAAGALEVFVREMTGRVGIRLPALDKGSVLLGRLAASAEAASKAVIATPGVGVTGGPNGMPGGMPPMPGSGGDRDGPETDSAGRPTG